MSDVRVSQAHSHGAAEARSRIQPFEDMMAKYGVKCTWKGNNGKLKGTGVSGTIQVTDDSVDVLVKLGMMAKAVGVKADKLEASIKKRLVAALDS